MTYPMVYYCLIKYIYGDLMSDMNALNIIYCQRPDTGLDGSFWIFMWLFFLLQGIQMDDYCHSLETESQNYFS